MSAMLIRPKIHFPLTQTLLLNAGPASALLYIKFKNKMMSSFRKHGCSLLMESSMTAPRKPCLATFDLTNSLDINSQAAGFQSINQ